jgi:Rps23 Pro-64 3,4-dihydroxylase Tpa1-like proline 4-hydroxylase
MQHDVTASTRSAGAVRNIHRHVYPEIMVARPTSMEKTIEAFYFDPDYLSDVSALHSAGYKAAKPFPHVVIDDFLPEAVAQRILDEFPSPGADDWYRFQRGTERKLQTTAELGIGPVARQVLNQFNSSAVIDFLETLTGVEHLVPDPHYSGGGLHQIERGGFLKVHADFNHHPRLDLERRLNLLLYLNRDWRDEWGGHLELWDTTMTSVVQRIAPTFNRCVVFSTTSFAYHGHPDPLKCPEGVTRKSMALYYYTKDRPPEELMPAHTTRFQRRPGEALNSRMPLKETLKRFVPPIVLDVARDRRKRTR